MSLESWLEMVEHHKRLCIMQDLTLISQDLTPISLGKDYRPNEGFARSDRPDRFSTRGEGVNKFV